MVKLKSNKVKDKHDYGHGHGQLGVEKCNLCELYCCPFQGELHFPTFEDMVFYIKHQLTRVPFIRWHRLMNFCRTNDIFLNICKECQKNYCIKKLSFYYFSTSPLLFILMCSCPTCKLIPVSCENFYWPPWSAVIPSMEKFMKEARTKEKKFLLGQTLTD